MKKVILCGLFLVSVTCFAKSNQTKTLPLFKEKKFVVFFMVENENLRAPFKELMVRNFQKAGMVFLDDNELDKKELNEKYRKGGMIIEINANQVIEQQTLSDFKKLPVVELALKVNSGVKILENGNYTVSSIWQQEKYIEMHSNDDSFVDTAVRNMSVILESFIEDYQKANAKQEAKFYLIS